MAILTDAEMLALGIPDEALEGLSSTVRDAHREAASERVVSAIGRRWSGATTYGYDCKEVAAVLATYSLIARRGYAPVAGASDPIIARVKLAEAWLALVVDGERDPTTNGTRIGAPMVATAGTPLWTRDAFNGPTSSGGCCS